MPKDKPYKLGAGKDKDAAKRIKLLGEGMAKKAAEAAKKRNKEMEKMLKELH